MSTLFTHGKYGARATVTLFYAMVWTPSLGDSQYYKTPALYIDWLLRDASKSVQKHLPRPDRATARHQAWASPD